MLPTLCIQRLTKRRVQERMAARFKLRNTPGSLDLSTIFVFRGVKRQNLQKERKQPRKIPQDSKVFHPLEVADTFSE